MKELECLIGKKFNLLTAIENIEPFIYKTKEGKTHTSKRYLCLCECGNKKEVVASNLKRGVPKSCGCLPKKNEMLIGMEFGRLKISSDPVYSQAKCKDKYYTSKMCECTCECGKKTLVTLNNLKSGNTSSCGCLRVELATNRMRLRNKKNSIYKLHIAFNKTENTG